MAQTNMVAQMYEENCFMRDPSLINFLVHILDTLSEFPIVLEASLLRGLDIWRGSLYCVAVTTDDADKQGHVIGSLLVWAVIYRCLWTFDDVEMMMWEIMNVIWSDWCFDPVTVIPCDVSWWVSGPYNPKAPDLVLYLPHRHVCGRGFKHLLQVINITMLFLCQRIAIFNLLFICDLCNFRIRSPYKVRGLR